MARLAAKRILGSKKRKQAKVKKVMGEYRRGDFKSSSGQRVTNRRQAIAISLSEAGLSKR